VTRYYRRAVTISDPEQLGGAMLGELSALFDLERVPPRQRTRAA
jgi:cobaltochelatase CobT